MYDDAYLCEVNLLFVSRILDDSLVDFYNYYRLLLIERYYQIIIFCHGGY